MERVKKFFRNIDLRKFLGTIVGCILFLCCVAYFTYAYYEWKSDEVDIALTIYEADVTCTLGPDVNVSNIGPVLKIEDGVKTSFGIENTFTEDMAVSVILDITDISESLLTESFKWAIVEDQEGGENFDYENPLIEGSFKNFRVGSNLIAIALQVPTQKTVSYEFIVYIDGNLKNDISIMQNSMEASLTLGNCGTDYIPYDEIIQFAFYSADDNSLTFSYGYPPTVGDTYEGKTVTKLYTGYDTTKYLSSSAVPWYSDGNYDDITSVTFLEDTTPTSTAYWFYGFSNLTEIDLTKLDTTNVTIVNAMFYACSSLINLDLSHFDTSNVTEMKHLFQNCSSLTELDLSNFNTSNVTNMGSMFDRCGSLISLNISHFDTSNVTHMTSMFYQCRNLTSLDLKEWDTGNVTHMTYMFFECSKLETLDLSHFDTSNVTTMSYMFYQCRNLTSLDLKEWDTGNVTNMTHMFCNVGSVMRSLDLSGWDTSNVEKMTSMFYGSVSLEEINISGWNTEKVTDMSGMFAHCISLETVVGLENLNTSNVTSMGGYIENGNENKGMFQLCSKLTGTITIRNVNTTYDDIFSSAATSDGAKITVNYISETSSLVDEMIATKGANSNIVKGELVI